MHIELVRIRNYKSFVDSGEILLSPSFNVVVGKNSSGKTAFIKLLKMQFDKNLPIGVRASSMSRMDIRFHIPVDQVSEFHSSGSDLYFPVRTQPSQERREAEASRVWNELRTKGLKVEFKVEDGTLRNSSLIGFASVQADQGERIDGRVAQLSHNATTGVYTLGNSPYTSVEQSRVFTNQIFSQLVDRIYYFDAQRSCPSVSAQADEAVLAANASNLPGAMMKLQKHTGRFRKLKARLSEVFPEIKDLTVTNVAENQAGLFVWITDSDSSGPDESIPLSEVGTGVAQVLAILFVVISSTKSSVVILEEPQSFLHPSAVRKLMGILSEYPQHQYVISTHSPTVISAVGPCNTLLFQKVGLETKITAFNPQESQDARMAMDELGVTFADVFGADNILWVEGPTEKKCIPLILDKLGSKRFQDTRIVHVDTTGDIEGKNNEKYFRIYKKFSEGEALVPPAVAFVLDREDRDQKSIDTLKVLLEGKVHFLQRRMFENYLLNTEAIAAQLNVLGESISSSDVQLLIEEWRHDNGLEEDDWTIKVHGAKLLNHVFIKLSEARHEYRKVEYGEALTQWLLDNDQTEDLQEIVDFLENVFEKDRTPQ